MRISYKRIAACYFMVVLLLFICIFRVFSVMSHKNYKQAADQISRRVVELDYSRGTIFDTNMNKITNAKEIYNVVIFNQPSALSSLYSHFTGAEIEKIIAEIKQNGFAVRKMSKEIKSEGICTYKRIEI